MADTHPQKLSSEEFQRFRDQIAGFSEQLRTVAEAITPAWLNHSYRDGGWTAAQVINHLADSHINAYVRIKMALTSDNPTLQGYDENKWAEMPDGKTEQIEESLSLVENIHRRLVQTLDSLTEEQRGRTYFHAGYQETRTIDFTISLYAWHGLHHLGQLRQIIPV